MGEQEEPYAHPDLPRSVLDNLLEGCQVISADYRYLYVNEAVVGHGKTSRGELLGRTMTECYPGIEDTQMFSVLQECMEQRVPCTFENEFEFPDGSRGWFELRMEPVPAGVVILSIDVTERKRSELALQRALKALTTLSLCNQTLVRATDLPQFLNDVARHLIHSGSYRATQIRIIGEDSDSEDLVAAVGDPELFVCGDTPSLEFEIPVRNKPVGTLAIAAPDVDVFGEHEQDLLEEIALDIGYGVDTLRARAAHARTEEQLLAAQRLEAVGRLAGGVAHDFNNLLSVILAYSGFAVDALQHEDAIRQDIEEIRQAGRRAAKLTRQLLAFSRKQILEPRVTNLNEIVSRLENMLHRLVREDISIQLDLASNLGNVLADPGKLEQVIMNLVVNARDAMPSGGELTLATRNLESLDPGDSALRVGQYVCLEVTDTGSGMEADVQNRIFEPFFTTKEEGKGTGLGLSMVYGFVKQSGGTIEVESEPASGTTFVIYLPLVESAAIEHPGRSRSNTPGSSNRTILVVEDEPSVRRVAERMLTSAGYEVVTAANGDEAMRAHQENDRIDLLLTDVVMPGMNGRELARQMKAMKPGLKVLYTSGYTDNAIAHHGVLDADARFMPKPFTRAELTRKVSEVLSEE